MKNIKLTKAQYADIVSTLAAAVEVCNEAQSAGCHENIEDYTKSYPFAAGFSHQAMRHALALLANV